MRNLIAHPFFATLILSTSMALLAAGTVVAAPSQALIEATLEEIASDAYGGRTPESTGLAAARDWIIHQLTLSGVQPAGETNDQGQRTFVQTYTTPLSGFGDTPPWDPNGDGLRTGHNIVGILYPPHWQSGAPTAMITAHYDGINEDVGFCAILDGSLENGFSDTCNAAVDNAASVGAILAILEEIKDQIHSPVAVIFFDGEEDLPAESPLWGETALIGSSYFAQHPTFERSKLQLHINLESVGYDLFPGMERHVFVVGAHSGGNNLKRDVDNALRGLHLTPQHAHYSLAQQRTDAQGFIRTHWNVPYIVYTNGPVSFYHTNADQYRPDLGNDNPVNVRKVQQVATAAARHLLTVTQSARHYQYKPLLYFNLGTTLLVMADYSVHQTLLDIIYQVVQNLGPDDADIRQQLMPLAQKLEFQKNNVVRWLLWRVNVLGTVELLNDMTTVVGVVQRHAHEQLLEAE